MISKIVGRCMVAATLLLFLLSQGGCFAGAVGPLLTAAHAASMGTMAVGVAAPVASALNKGKGSNPGNGTSPVLVSITHLEQPVVALTRPVRNVVVAPLEDPDRTQRQLDMLAGEIRTALQRSGLVLAPTIPMGSSPVVATAEADHHTLYYRSRVEKSGPTGATGTVSVTLKEKGGGQLMASYRIHINYQRGTTQQQIIEAGVGKVIEEMLAICGSALCPVSQKVAFSP